MERTISYFDQVKSVVLERKPRKLGSKNRARVKRLKAHQSHRARDNAHPAQGAKQGRPGSYQQPGTQFRSWWGGDSCRAPPGGRKPALQRGSWAVAPTKGSCIRTGP